LSLNDTVAAIRTICSTWRGCSDGNLHAESLARGHRAVEVEEEELERVAGVRGEHVGEAFLCADRVGSGRDDLNKMKLSKPQIQINLYKHKHT
jgi:hypothetical protein